MNLLSSVDAASLSILKDPFDSKNINAVMLRAWRMHDGTFAHYATIEFKNGDTKGEQRIDAASFDELIFKTKAFIETLKPKVHT